MENQPASLSYQVKAVQAALFRKVYLWMSFALFITGITALLVADSPSVVTTILGNKMIFYGLLLSEIALVWYLSARIFALSLLNATLLFILYSILNGATLCILFFIFTMESIASTFFITAGTFGAISLYGYVTKRDLSSLGSLLFMALIGLIIASLTNLFLKSEALYWVVTYAGVLIFVGLTAYDTQKIKRIFSREGLEINETTQKYALLGALTLYLDFINLFLFLLRIVGNRK